MEPYTAAFSQSVACEKLSLFYGDIVSQTPLTVLDSPPMVPTLTPDERIEENRESVCLGWGIRQFGLDDADASAVVQGQQLKGGRREVAFNTYSFAVRYLARRKLRDLVLNQLTRQAKRSFNRSGVRAGSLVLVAHSLGSVISLDLLANGGIGALFSPVRQSRLAPGCDLARTIQWRLTAPAASGRCPCAGST